MISCIPQWPQKMGGTLLIVGSAPCLFDDLGRALELRPDAHVLLINGASQLVERGEYLLAGHYDKAEQFVEARKRRFPKPIIVHASYRDGREMPKCVHYAWRGVATGGTSAWKAVRIGKGMGYDELVLCGCPLDDSGYAQGESDGITHSCKRIGDGHSKGTNRMYDNYRESFAIRAKDEGQGVYSMSGYSRSLLGAPC